MLGEKLISLRRQVHIQDGGSRVIPVDLRTFLDLVRLLVRVFFLAFRFWVRFMGTEYQAAAHASNISFGPS